jgi:hypothetical protein
MRLPLLVLLLSLAVLAPITASAVPHQLFLDFDIDGDLWTINPYPAAVPVSLVIQIGDDPIPTGADVFLYFELGCYFDPESMEGRNCASIDCAPEWGAPGVLQYCWVDCPPLADCWDPIMMANFDPAFVPQPGERYLLGTRYLGCGGGDQCAGASYYAWGHVAGSEVTSNRVGGDAPSSVPEEGETPPVASPTWGAMKALFRDPR